MLILFHHYWLLAVTFPRYVAGRLAWHVFSFKGQVKKNFNAMYTCWLA